MSRLKSNQEIKEIEKVIESLKTSHSVASLLLNDSIILSLKKLNFFKKLKEERLQKNLQKKILKIEKLISQFEE
jgi:hypothetical protein